MPFEYSVVPAPRKGQKAKGVKSTEDRFAYALEAIMNEKGAEGWEYVRTDTLPSEERQGLTGSKTVYQNMMVFRRSLVAEDPAEPPKALLEAPKVNRAAEDDIPPLPSFSSRSNEVTAQADDDPLVADPKLRAE